MVFKAGQTQTWPRGPVVPWETVAALREEWAGLLEQIGVSPEDYTCGRVHGAAVGVMLRDEGLPTQGALARKYGLHQAKVSMILRGRLYREV